jgi:hypothetical protein
MSDSIKKYEELKEEGKLNSKPSIDYTKYAELLISVSTDYLLQTISQEHFISMISLIESKIKK